MDGADRREDRGRLAIAWRFASTIVAMLIVETVVCGLSALPILLFWLELVRWTPSDVVMRAAVFSVSLVPSYTLFALCVMAWTPLVTRLTGRGRLRTPSSASPRWDGR